MSVRQKWRAKHITQTEPLAPLRGEGEPRYRIVWAHDANGPAGLCVGACVGRKRRGLVMKRIGLCLLGLLFLAGTPAVAADDTIRIELNTAEVVVVQGRCRLSFVIENKGETAYDSLKLDLVIFNREQVIQRRVVAEMAPLRRTKTIVKAFEIEGDCAQMGSVLLNDVTACMPGDAGTCLDRLELSSRIQNVRFFK
jgi:hypothetical protein